MRASSASHGDFPTRGRLAAVGERLRRAVGLPLVLADNRSRLAASRLRRGGRSDDAGEEPIALNVRALEGRPVHVRPGTTDVEVVIDDFVYGFHLPPVEAEREKMRVIWELGTNIGAAAAHFAVRHPEATVVGVEPDPGNVALARRNLAPWRDRVEVVEAAVWDADRRLEIVGDEEFGLSVRERGGDGEGGIQGLSLNTLLARHGPEGSIDFMLMDIEGSEARVLARETEWAQRVRAIKVELHPETGYGPTDCARDLARLGFGTRPAPLWWGGFVYGLRG
jgi:FkbM family methyltransferase